MSPTAALQSEIFLIYSVAILGALAAVGILLFVLAVPLKRDTGSITKTYVGWLVIVPAVIGALFAGREAAIVGVALLSAGGFKEFSKATGLYRDWWATGIVYAGIALIAASALVTDPRREVSGWYGLFIALIPLPNHLHPEWTKAAASMGKHVLCEKPLAMTSNEAREMVDACHEAGVLLMEAFMYRLHPLWVKAKELVDSGAIGELRSVHTIFSYFNDDPTNIRNIPEVGGGALYDIGCYAVNTARLLFGSEPTVVKGSVWRDEELGTDVLTSALLDFGGGHSTFVCSTQMEPNQRVDIVGTEGRLEVEIPFNIPPDRPTRILHVSGGEPPVSPGSEIHEIPTVDPYAVQADAFSKAIRTGSPVPVPPDDAVANLEVIERIFADAEG